MLTTAPCFVALKWKKWEPTFLFELHYRIQDVKRMEYLTAYLTHSLDAHNRVWGLWDHLEAPPAWHFPGRDTACADGGFWLGLGSYTGGFSSLPSPSFTFFFFFPLSPFPSCTSRPLLCVQYSAFVAAYLSPDKIWLCLCNLFFSSWKPDCWSHPATTALGDNLFCILIWGPTTLSLLLYVIICMI